MSSDRNIASQVKHNHDAMVQIDDELKRLQAKRTELEERNQLLLATLSNNSSLGTSPKGGLNLSSECVLLLALMMFISESVTFETIHITSSKCTVCGSNPPVFRYGQSEKKGMLSALRLSGIG